MAKQTSAQNKYIMNLIKVGKPRRTAKRKGNAPAKTSRSGTGKRIR